VLWHRVVPTRVPRVAPRDPLDRKPAPSHHAVSLDRSEGIRGARGGEPATWRERGRYEPSIAPDRQQHHRGHRVLHARDTPTRLKPERSARSSSVGDAVGVVGRAMTTTSQPAHGPPDLRVASRRTRLERLRTTAPPSRLPATKSTRPSRPLTSGVRLAMSVTTLPVALIPSLKMLSISLAFFSVCMGQPFGPRSRLLRRARAEHLAALATTCGEDRTTRTGRHTLTEAVRLRALPVVRLIRALHFRSLHSVRRDRPGHKPGDYIRGPAGVSINDLVWPV